MLLTLITTLAGKKDKKSRQEQESSNRSKNLQGSYTAERASQGSHRQLRETKKLNILGLP
jgi:hypothetical protein